MADLGATSWSETDASNNALPPNGWPEGMAPSDVNNAARAEMGGEKRFWVRTNSVFTTAGTTTAYTLTYGQAASAYYDGEEFSFIVNATCGAAPTLNINALGARQIRAWQGAAFANAAAGDLLINQQIRVRYNLSTTTFDVISTSNFRPPVAAVQTFRLTSNLTVSTTPGSPTSVINTGSIGAAGWLVEISADVAVSNGGGGNTTAVAAISDGTVSVCGCECSMVTGFSASMSMRAIVTLSAATTFTLLGAASGATTGFVRAPVNAIVPSINDKMTNLTWRRWS